MDLLKFAERHLNFIDGDIVDLKGGLKPGGVGLTDPSESVLAGEFIKAYEELAGKFRECLTKAAKAIEKGKKPDRKEIIAFVLRSSCMTFEMFKLSKQDKEKFIKEAGKKMRHFISDRLLVGNELEDEPITLADLSEPVSIEGVSLEPLRLQETDNIFINDLFTKYGYLDVLIYVANKYGIGYKTVRLFFEAARDKGEGNVDALSLVLSVLQDDEGSVVPLLLDEKVKGRLDKGIGFEGIKYTPLYYAILTRNAAMIALLLSKGATKLHEDSKDDEDFAKDCKPLFGEGAYNLFCETYQLFMLDMLEPILEQKYGYGEGEKRFELSEEKFDRTTKSWQGSLNKPELEKFSLLEKFRIVFPGLTFPERLAPPKSAKSAKPGSYKTPPGISHVPHPPKKQG